jgi:hypothetical protein
VWIHLTGLGSIGTCKNGSCNIFSLFLKVRIMVVGRVLAFEEDGPSHELRLRIFYPSLK